MIKLTLIVEEVGGSTMAHVTCDISNATPSEKRYFTDLAPSLGRPNNALHALAVSEAKKFQGKATATS
jgi:hypothetical protein